MGQMEHLLNVYASRSAKDSIAPFVGYSQVEANQATRSLTEGLWLVSLKKPPKPASALIFVVQKPGSSKACRLSRHISHGCEPSFKQPSLVILQWKITGRMLLYKDSSGSLQLWRFEGGMTLAHYLRRRDCIQQLAGSLGVSQQAVVPTIMQQIFEGLSVWLLHPIQHLG